MAGNWQVPFCGFRRADHSGRRHFSFVARAGSAFSLCMMRHFVNGHFLFGHPTYPPSTFLSLSLSFSPSFFSNNHYLQSTAHPIDFLLRTSDERVRGLVRLLLPILNWNHQEIISFFFHRSFQKCQSYCHIVILNANESINESLEL